MHDRCEVFELTLTLARKTSYQLTAIEPEYAREEDFAASARFSTRRVLKMQANNAGAVRRKSAKGIRRVLDNLARFPIRTGQSVARLLDPAYRLERQAHRKAAKLLSFERRRELATVPGMSSTHECELLFYLANTAPSGGTIVEIGAWKGKSAAWLIEGSTLRSDPLDLVSIDPHQLGSWEEFSETVRRFELERRGLRVLRTGSDVAAKNWNAPISLLWIDGDHDYEPVLRDIDGFAPHVLPGGFVVFDDATTGDCPGVPRAIADRMTNNPQFRHAGAIRHLELFQRL